MQMRQIMDLLESEDDTQVKWWINVRTGEIRPVARAHGDETKIAPEAFGISQERIEQIKRDHPDLDPDGDGWGELSWWELIRYEAQKNGWVRAGSFQEGSDSGAPYVYALNLRAAQLAIGIMMKKGWLIDKCEIEITNPQNPVEGHGDFYELEDERQIKQFMLRRR